MPQMASPDVMGFDPVEEIKRAPEEVSYADGEKELIFYGVEQVIDTHAMKFRYAVVMALFFGLFFSFILYGLNFVVPDTVGYISESYRISIIIGSILFGFAAGYVLSGANGYDFNSTVPMGSGPTNNVTGGAVAFAVDLADLAYKNIDPKDYYAPYHDAWSKRLHITNTGIKGIVDINSKLITNIAQVNPQVVEVRKRSYFLSASHFLGTDSVRFLFKNEHDAEVFRDKALDYMAIKPFALDSE